MIAADNAQVGPGHGGIRQGNRQLCLDFCARPAYGLFDDFDCVAVRDPPVQMDAWRDATDFQQFINLRPGTMYQHHLDSEADQQVDVVGQ